MHALCNSYSTNVFDVGKYAQLLGASTKTRKNKSCKHVHIVVVVIVYYNVQCFMCRSLSEESKQNTGDNKVGFLCQSSYKASQQQ